MMKWLLCGFLYFGPSALWAKEAKVQFLVFERAGETQTKASIDTKQFARLKSKFENLIPVTGDIKKCPRNFTQIRMLEGAKESRLLACHNVRLFREQKEILKFAEHLKKESKTAF